MFEESLKLNAHVNSQTKNTPFKKRAFTMRIQIFLKFGKKLLTSQLILGIILTVDGELAQLARASALHAGGQGFESLILHHYREVAQLGRAFGLGPRGCRFKSCLPDHDIDMNYS